MEIYVRKQILWTFNDRVRNRKDILVHGLDAVSFDQARDDKGIFVQETDEVLWKQNCQRLIELLDTTDVNEKIMIAELHRNLGEFDVCMELINSLDKDIHWIGSIVGRFKIECENRNKSVIKF